MDGRRRRDLKLLDDARKAVGVLRSVLDLAVRDRRIAANPALGVTLPRLPLSEQRFLTVGQLGGLADANAVGTRHRPDACPGMDGDSPR
jgi:hypothetical protein